MSQKQLDDLVSDGLELFIYGDQTELCEFFGYLADKYELKFDSEKYIRIW